jgi:competence ComEA-like helix-hairpin-helix protein
MDLRPPRFLSALGFRVARNWAAPKWAAPKWAAPKWAAPKWAAVKPLLNTSEQPTVAALVAIGLFAILTRWCWLAACGQPPIRFDRAAPLQVDFQISINDADWPEFTLLPGIGETLAQRIVEYRRDQGAFESVDDLQRVKGIGPKTMRRIRPFLRLD